MSTFVEQSPDDRGLPYFEALGRCLLYASDLTPEDLVLFGEIPTPRDVPRYIEHQLMTPDVLRDQGVVQLARSLPSGLEIPMREQAMEWFSDGDIEDLMQVVINEKIKDASASHAVDRHIEQAASDRIRIAESIAQLATAAYDKNYQTITDADIDAIRLHYLSGVSHMTYVKKKHMPTRWCAVLPDKKLSSIGNISTLTDTEKQAKYLVVMDPDVNSQITRSIAESRSLFRSYLAKAICDVIRGNISSLESRLKTLVATREQTVAKKLESINHNIGYKAFDLIHEAIPNGDERVIFVTRIDYSGIHPSEREFMLSHNNREQLMISWHEIAADGSDGVYRVVVKNDKKHKKLTFHPQLFPHNRQEGYLASRDHSMDVVSQFFSGMQIVDRTTLDRSGATIKQVVKRRAGLTMAQKTLEDFFQTLNDYNQYISGPITQVRPCNNQYFFTAKKPGEFFLGIGDLQIKTSSDSAAYN